MKDYEESYCLLQTIQPLFQNGIVDSHAKITGLAIGVLVGYLFRQRISQEHEER